MWNNSKASKALIIVVCVLVIGIAGCGNGISSHERNAATVASNHSVVSTSSATMHPLSLMTTDAGTFQVTSIDMTVSPTDISLWKCGSYIQVLYNAIFHVVSGPNGGIIDFSYTLNNGRSQTPEKLTIIPGQQQSNFYFTWQGSLPADHTYPGPGGVLVTSPNNIVSQLVSPTGKCS